MHSLTELKTVKPRQITIEYLNVVSGAKLHFRRIDVRPVDALHTGFVTQISDHGADSMAGHHNQTYDAMSAPFDLLPTAHGGQDRHKTCHTGAIEDTNHVAPSRQRWPSGQTWANSL